MDNILIPTITIPQILMKRVSLLLCNPFTFTEDK
jgi:hypothetical protein